MEAADTANAAEQHVEADAPDVDIADEADQFEADVDLSAHVESLRDFFSDVEAISAGAESAVTAEELEAAIAAV